jgi:hypothetical protein
MTGHASVLAAIGGMSRIELTELHKVVQHEMVRRGGAMQMVPSEWALVKRRDYAEGEYTPKPTAIEEMDALEAALKRIGR